MGGERVGVKVKFWKGAWWIFLNHRGRRKAKRVGDRDTALALARRLRTRLLEGQFSLPAATSETFDKYARAWLKSGAAERKASTQRFYSFNLEQHILPVIGTRPIASIARADCRTVLAEGRAKGLKIASIQGVQRTLSAVLSQAVEDDILQANPAFRMGRHVRRGDEPRKAIDPLTREEAHAFLQTIDTRWPDYYAFFLAALRTGMRLGELLALQWGDVDLKGRFIDVQRNLVAGTLTTPKNRNRRRVDMSAHLAETLQKRLTAAKAAKLKAGATELVPWVFANRDGDPLDGDNLRKRVFAKALTAAGLRHIRLHDLRHTFASLLIQQGESLAYIRDQMGHSSIQVTVDVYGHLVPGSNRAAVDRLDVLDATQCNPDATGERSSETGRARK